MLACAAEWGPYIHMLEELQERADKDKERAKPAAAAKKSAKKRGEGGSGRKAKPTARRRAHAPFDCLHRTEVTRMPHTHSEVHKVSDRWILDRA